MSYMKFLKCLWSNNRPQIRCWFYFGRAVELEQAFLCSSEPDPTLSSFQTAPSLRAYQYGRFEMYLTTSGNGSLWFGESERYQYTMVTNFYTCGVTVLPLNSTTVSRLLIWVGGGGCQVPSLVALSNSPSPSSARVVGFSSFAVRCMDRLFRANGGVSKEGGFAFFVATESSSTQRGFSSDLQSAATKSSIRGVRGVSIRCSMSVSWSRRNIPLQRPKKICFLKRLPGSTALTAPRSSFAPHVVWFLVSGSSPSRSRQQPTWWSRRFLNKGKRATSVTALTYSETSTRACLTSK